MRKLLAIAKKNIWWIIGFAAFIAYAEATHQQDLEDKAVQGAGIGAFFGLMYGIKEMLERRKTKKE